MSPPWSSELAAELRRDREELSTAFLILRPQLRHPPPKRGTVRTVEGKGTTEITLDGSDDVVLVDAHDGDVKLKLADPATCANQMLLVKRIDGHAGHSVTFDGSGDGLDLRPLRGGQEIRIYSTDKLWHDLERMTGGEDGGFIAVRVREHVDR